MSAATGTRVQAMVAWAAAVLLSGHAWAGPVRWQSDYEAALRAAKQRDALVMVWVAYDHCSLCEELDRKAFSSPRVDEMATLFECVRDEGQTRKASGKGGEPETLAERFKVLIHPTILFLDPNGPVEIHRVQSSDQPAAKFQGIMADMLELHRAQGILAGDKNDADALFTVGHIEVGLERYDDAAAPLRAALAADPGNKLGHAEDIKLDLAICTLQTQTPDRKARTSPGIEQLQAFLKAYPKSARAGEARFFLGSGWLAITNDDEARKCWQKVVETEPETSEWRQMSERLLLPLEIKQLQDHLIQHPDDAEACFQLGQKATESGQYASAPRFLAKYLSLDHDNKLGHLEDAWLDMGICDVNRVATGKGILQLERFRTEHPNSPRMPEALYHLGCAYTALGNDAKAKEVLRELVRRYPKSPLAPEAQQLLDQIG